MTHGNNHAKQLVVDEGADLAKELHNNPEDQATTGRLLVKIYKMVAPMYMASFVTVEECDAIHKKNKPAAKPVKIKIGPIQLEGPITGAIILNSVPLICCGVLLFALGKSQNWW